MSDAVDKLIAGNHEASEKHRIAYGKEMFNLAIDHAIEVINKNMRPYYDPHSEYLISKLQSLKK